MWGILSPLLVSRTNFSAVNNFFSTRSLQTVCLHLVSLQHQSSCLQKNRWSPPSNVLRQGFCWDITSTCLCFQHLFSGRWRVTTVLQTTEPQKYYHVTRIFDPQTNGPWSGPKKALVHGRPRWIVLVPSHFCCKQEHEMFYMVWKPCSCRICFVKTEKSWNERHCCSYGCSSQE